MGHYEDTLVEVYYEVEEKGLKDEFHKQLYKMKFQKKHRHKSVRENWEYALYRIKGGKSK
jgi:hypothetical protein